MGEYKEGGGGNGLGFSLGLMAGMLFGVGLGMLLAPKSGSELRSDLGARARRASDSLANQYRTANDAAHAWAERGREVAHRADVLAEHAADRDHAQAHHLLAQLEGYEGQEWPPAILSVEATQPSNGSTTYRRRAAGRNLEIVAIDEPSGAERVIAAVPGLVLGQTSPIRPSPDGRLLAFRSGANLYIVPSAGGEARIVMTAEGLGGGRWAADSRTMFTTANGNPGRLFRVDVETGEARQVLTFPGSSDMIFNHDWSRVSIIKPKEGPPVSEI